jgi:hypothetical protein
VSTLKNLFRIGTRAIAVTAIVRQVRRAREEGDPLQLLDAVVNMLAILIAIAIIVREIREHSGDKGEAIEEAPV